MLNYNENKVEEGLARLIFASGFGVDHSKLKFLDKLNRLQNQADLNPAAKKKVIHIIVGFSPEDSLNDTKMQDIIQNYMDQIGFGNQPYLVYRHTDTAHPHVHVVTTKIDPNGARIDTFRIGKYRSEKARKALEDAYGLIKAQGKKESHNALLHPSNVKKLEYGKTPTKGSMSNIVRSVITHYKFSSIHELNATLRQFNVVAYRGEEGSLMYENNGLVYCCLNEKGERVGKAIKASSIFDQPTLSILEKEFAKKGKQKEPKFQERVRRIIDSAMTAGLTNKEDFIDYMGKNGIYVLFRQNEEKRVYGVTYVDNKSLCVFNGRPLGEQYSAKGILERLAGGDTKEIMSNRAFAGKILAETNYANGFSKVMAGWVSKGMLVGAETSVTGRHIYKLGYALSDRETYVPADSRLSRYLEVNGYTPDKAALLNERMQQEFDRLPEQDILSVPIAFIENLVEELITAPAGEDRLDYHWLSEYRKRRRKKRR